MTRSQTEGVRRLRFLFVGIGVLVASLVGVWHFARLPVPVPIKRAPYFRPQGMAPVAFAAFVQACHASKVHPWRISQTVGDHPRSVGYHLRDGTIAGEDYTVAVDMGVNDLSAHKRDELLEALARCGFASWYRTGPKWNGVEHVHAVYAGLPMKPQLRKQVRLWVRERRQHNRKLFRWQRSWRQFWL